MTNRVYPQKRTVNSRWWLKADSLRIKHSAIDRHSHQTALHPCHNVRHAGPDAITSRGCYSRDGQPRSHDSGPDAIISISRLATGSDDSLDTCYEHRSRNSHVCGTRSMTSSRVASPAIAVLRSLSTFNKRWVDSPEMTNKLLASDDVRQCFILMLRHVTKPVLFIKFE